MPEGLNMDSEAATLNLGNVITKASPDVEEFAELLHESARVAVENGNTVAQAMHGNPVRAFIEWKDLSFEAQQGRIQSAAWLMQRFEISYK